MVRGRHGGYTSSHQGPAPGTIHHDATGAVRVIDSGAASGHCSRDMQNSRAVAGAILALAIAVVLLAGVILATAGREEAGPSQAVTCVLGGTDGIPRIEVEGSCPPDVQEILENVGGSI